MTFYHKKANATWPYFAIFLFLILLLLLTGCNDSNQGQTSTASKEGQQLLANVVRNLNTAKTLHGTFNLSITGQVLNGSTRTEIWNEAPSKNRTLVLQSSLQHYAAGTIVVTNGKQEWLYNPAQKVVYTTPLTSMSGSGTPAGGSTNDIVQSLSPLPLIQSIFARSDAELISSSATINGHAAYDVNVVSKPKAVGAHFTGEVYIDKTTELPLHVTLYIQGPGQVVIDIPVLTLNQPIPDTTFVFIPPAGTRVSASQPPSNTPITLAQAQVQADYHLLVIPNAQGGYVLHSVHVLGTLGSEVYVFNYTKGNQTFSIAESKALANHSDSSGTPVNVRGTTGTISTDSGVTTLSWTEYGVGITINGPFSNNDILAISQLLI